MTTFSMEQTGPTISYVIHYYDIDSEEISETFYTLEMASQRAAALRKRGVSFTSWEITPLTTFGLREVLL